MSSLAIYVGAGGMLAQSEKMTAIGNNIANNSTVGYKSSTVTFAEHFVALRGTAPNGSTQISGNGVTVADTATNWRDGVIRETGNIAHLSVAGDGFMEVQLGTDNYFTRAGDFTLIEDSGTPGTFILVRPNGASLQGAGTAGGATVAEVRFDALPDSFAVSGAGVITAQGANVTNGFIGLQRFANPDALIRHENGMYEQTSAASAISTDPVIPGTSGTGIYIQGSLELSNVELVNEFSEMIITQRAFQANSKTIMTASEMLQIVVNLKR
ncbi:MAG: flagellar hook-basal body complex protein [Lentisphaeria bacterium]|nr:flagellar hook-basal body complex protein [Lentisphaeria bacterium]NQZ70172.1 flagellar hook-basal body complex protein [Lentisphaeria bacterium]